MITPQMMRVIQKVNFISRYPKTGAANIIARFNRIERDMVEEARKGESHLRISLEIITYGKFLGKVDTITKDETQHQVLTELYTGLGYMCWSEENDLIISWAPNMVNGINPDEL